MKIVFKHKNGDFSHVKTTLEDHFTKLQSQNGAFELLTADRGENARPFTSIHIPDSGYTVKYLKEAVPGRAVIYVTPIQSDLSMDILKKEDDIKVHPQCVNCHENIPLVEMKEHSEVCKGGSSGCTHDCLTAFPQKDETSATQSVSTTVLGSDIPGNDNEV